MKSSTLIANSNQKSLKPATTRPGVIPPRSGTLQVPIPVRRRHSLAPETITQAAATLNNNNNNSIPPIPPRLLQRNQRRSLIFSSSINGGANSAQSQSAQLVAIDSKIEQAMDLVKTHLMFAVREEVELLRSKILELETTVIQLEAENSILREHVPTEILQNLTLQPGANNVSSATNTLMT